MNKPRLDTNDILALTLIMITIGMCVDSACPHADVSGTSPKHADERPIVSAMHTISVSPTKRYEPVVVDELVSKPYRLVPGSKAYRTWLVRTCADAGIYLTEENLREGEAINKRNWGHP